MSKRNPIIRTDKWSLNPTAQQRLLFAETVRVYQRLCKHLVGIVFTHWTELGNLTSEEITPAVERLMHQTQHRPIVKYPGIDRNGCLAKDSFLHTPARLQAE